MKRDRSILLTTPRFNVVYEKYRAYEVYYLTKNDGVSAICTDEAGRILLLTVNRLNIDGHHLELPGGRVELGDDPTTAICKELNEETGIEVKEESLERLISTMPLPSLSNETVHVFLLRNATLAPDKSRDIVGHEGILKIEFYRRDAICEMIRTGMILSGIDGFALLYYLHWSNDSLHLDH